MAEPLPDANGASRVWSGRLPLGLIFSMLAATGSLGAIVIMWKMRWPSSNAFESVVHSCAGLTLCWAAAAHLVSRGNSRLSEGSPAFDLLSVINIVQLVLTLVVSVVMLYLATAAVLARVPSLTFFSLNPSWEVLIWPAGSVDIALVSVAALMAWWRTGNGAIMTGLMWLLFLMALWSALQIPALVIHEENGISQVVLVDWVSPFILGASLSLAALTTIGGVLAQRRRMEAWPDRLDDLLTPPPAWPGFYYSAGVIAVIVLVLGCMFIASPITPFAAFIAGGSVLVLAARRWNENYADTGLGLITLAVVSLLMLGTPDVRGNKAEYFAAVFSRALLGLAVMTAFWHWMARVWDQQLDNGKSWTTAGALIRPCRRLGFLLGTIGVLVAMQLAFWPKMPNVYMTQSTGGWVWGIVANLTLVAALTGAARRTGKPTVAWLACCALVALAAFVVVRSGGTWIHAGFLEYWPLLVAFAAGGCAVLSWLTARSAGWRAFYEPAYVLAVLVNPVVAIAGAALIGSLMIPAWVTPATFGVLAGAFLLVAWLPGPRRFAILTFVCAGAAVWYLRGM